MTPKQQSEKMETEIKQLGFQVDTYRYRQIKKYAIGLLKRELQEVEKVAKVNMTEMIRYWDEVEKEL